MVVVSRRLKPSARQPDVVIDWLGVLLSAGAIVLLTVATAHSEDYPHQPAATDVVAGYVWLIDS